MSTPWGRVADGGWHEVALSWRADDSLELVVDGETVATTRLHGDARASGRNWMVGCPSVVEGAPSLLIDIDEVTLARLPGPRLSGG